MELSLAPMEEITGYVFRNVLNRHFAGVDKYYTPFITPNQNKIMKTRDGREINPEHNSGLNVVPQVLTNNSEHFNELALTLEELGYEEINLNFGCPSGTVLKKYKGSGIFRDTDILERFLEGVFSEKRKAKISVKSRIGYDDPEEFEDILKIYNRYPISQLTIHPRVAKDMYKGEPRLSYFEKALEQSNIPIIYNGNIFDKEDYTKANDKYGASVAGIMIGRGAVKDPGIFRNIHSGKTTSVSELKAFTEDLYESYASEFSETDGLFKMKEVWFYMKDNFEDIEKPLKKIRKAKTRAEYMEGVREIFSTNI